MFTNIAFLSGFALFRLALLKKELTEKQQTTKEKNAELKLNLDSAMERYTAFQSKLDKLSKQLETPEVTAGIVIFYFNIFLLFHFNDSCRD